MVFQRGFKEIFFFGELPPRTLHGASISNLINVEILKNNFSLDYVEEYSDLKHHESFSYSKVICFLTSVFKSWKLYTQYKYNFFYGVLYLSFGGILKNLLLVIVFKVFNPSSEIILHLHRSDIKLFLKSWYCKALFIILKKLTSKFIVLSNRQFDEISSLTNNKVFLLYNSIQESELSFNHLAFNKSNKIRVIFFSNFLKDKGFFDLLEVFSILEVKFPDCFLLECYGEFASIKDQQSLKSHLVTKNIFIYNSVYGSSKNKVLNTADLIVLPSYNEGMPLILLEAMYLGKPIIISRVGYIDEALGPNYPLYCKAGDIDSIVKCFIDFKDFYSNSELCLDLKNKYNKFSLQGHKQRLLNIFNK